MGKRVSIVFEEDGLDGSGEPTFNVFLEGISPERSYLLKMMSPADANHEMSTSEFWALHIFRIAIDALRVSGAVRSVSKKPGG